MKNIFGFKIAYKYAGKCFIAILLTVILLGIFFYDVQAYDTVLGINFNEYSSSRFGFSSFTADTEAGGADSFCFQLNGESINLNLLDPTEPLLEVEGEINIVDWHLDTPAWDVTLDFKSTGVKSIDNDNGNENLPDDYANEFFKYTIATEGFEDKIFLPEESASLQYLASDTLYNGSIKVEYSPEFSEKSWCAVKSGKYRDIILITVSGEPIRVEETAWGGDSEGSQGLRSAWWYYYDYEYGSVEQTIWAGQHYDIGTVRIEDMGNEKRKVEIDFEGGWSLQDDSEAIKVQGYEEADLPVSFPGRIGQFETYQGNDLKFWVDPFPFYLIHLDVKS